MEEKTSGEPCAAHNCLKPRWKDGWCATHWYGHSARMMLHAGPDPQPDSLAICEAIWAASPPHEL